MKQWKILSAIILCGGLFSQSAISATVITDDPFIISEFTVRNLSDEARTYTISTSVPTDVGMGFPSSFVGGSIFAALIDADGDGSASLSAPGDGSGIFQGKIDGATALNLLNTDSSCMGVACSTSVSDFDGLSNLVILGDALPAGLDNTLVGPAVAGMIAIDLIFTLSAGDEVKFQNYFEVNPIPLPGAALLFLSGLAGLFGFMRKGSYDSGAA